MKLKRKICLLLGLILILSAALMPVAYANDEGVVWQIEQNGSAVYKDGKKMSMYQGSRSFDLDPRTVYSYANSLEFTDASGNSCSSIVRSSSAEAEFVWVSGLSENYIYASTVGMAELDAFLAGTSVKYTLDEGNKSADIAISEIQALDKAAREQTGTVSVEVTNLKDQQRYDVVARDTTYTFAYLHGAIYYVSGTYYYLCYDMLGNNYFDANGDFSYRSGTVALTVVDAMSASVIDQVISEQKVYEVQYDFESGYSALEPMFEVLYWTAFIFAGIVVPLPLLTVGIILSAKTKKTRWKIFAALAAAWLILAVLFAIVLFI